MSLRGVDSAYPPTLAQARAAVAAGVRFWGLYVGGSWALNVWTPAEAAILRSAGVEYLLPVWVPSPADIDSADPARLAFEARLATMARGLTGAVVLDTEAAERGMARLPAFVDGFCEAQRAAKWRVSVYSGANYVPSWVADWRPEWGHSPTTPGLYQTGQGTIKGVTVDFDLDTAAGFPFARWAAETPPAAAPRTVAELARALAGALEPFTH